MKIPARRRLCEHVEAADVRALRRAGHIGDEQRHVLFKTGEFVNLVEIPCNFGGMRQAFVCPGCDRRAFILYRRGTWACRLCHGLVYANENATRHNRRLNKALKLRERLGQTSGGIFVRFPGRPKGRWWHTYLRERRRGHEIEQQLLSALAKKYGMTT